MVAALLVCPRLPKHVEFAAVVDVAGQNEQVVREAIDVFHDLFGDRFDSGQLGQKAFAAADHRAGKVKVCACRRAAWEHEGVQGLQSFVHGVDFRLRPVKLGSIGDEGGGR